MPSSNDERRERGLSRVYPTAGNGPRAARVVEDHDGRRECAAEDGLLHRAIIGAAEELAQAVLDSFNADHLALTEHDMRRLARRVVRLIHVSR
jgi:hypothetical protein